MKLIFLCFCMIGLYAVKIVGIKSKTSGYLIFYLLSA